MVWLLHLRPPGGHCFHLEGGGGRDTFAASNRLFTAVELRELFTLTCDDDQDDAVNASGGDTRGGFGGRRGGGGGGGRADTAWKCPHGVVAAPAPLPSKSKSSKEQLRKAGASGTVRTVLPRGGCGG